MLLPKIPDAENKLTRKYRKRHKPIRPVVEATNKKLLSIPAAEWLVSQSAGRFL